MENSKDENKKGKEQDEPKAQHSSQGHKTDAKGTVTNTREETLRAATTDSTRTPKNGADDGPTGGNVR